MTQAKTKMAKVWNYESRPTDKLAEKVAKDPDIVYTNPEMAKNLLSTIIFTKGDIVMEPCRGKGAFYDNFPDIVRKEYCEMNEGIDYLKYEGTVDITISNPPFVPRKLFWNFHLKAMETTRKEIYWLINMCSLNVFTPKRLGEMKDKGWFINGFNIVSDKRWFGRYALVKISKIDNDFFNWHMKSF